MPCKLISKTYKKNKSMNLKFDKKTGIYYIEVVPNGSR